MGVKYLDAAAETLNYVIDGMEKKSAPQKYHYITHRLMQDMQHKCIARTAPEEANLAANWDSHDVMNAEFIRTHRAQDFNGGVLLQRYEAEVSLSGIRSVNKVLPKIGDKEASDNIYLRCFDDVYGFRCKNEGKGRHLYYLIHWNF